MSYGRVVLWCRLLALVVAVGGCQRGPAWNLAPVEGTVTKEGRPLEGVEVVFLVDAGTEGPKARGTTDAAGHYRLRTDNGDEGAVVGKHRVCIVDPPLMTAIDPSQVNPEKPPEPAKLVERRRVPPSYGRFDKTPLRIEIGRQPLTFDITIP